MPDQISDEHRKVFDDLGYRMIIMLMQNGQLVSHLMAPAQNWLMEEAAKKETAAIQAQREKDNAAPKG